MSGSLGLQLQCLVVWGSSCSISGRVRHPYPVQNLSKLATRRFPSAAAVVRDVRAALAPFFLRHEADKRRE